MAIDDYDIVPGTVYIVNCDDDEATNKILLVPTPSDDLSDPLRWSKLRKYYHLAVLVAYSALCGALTNWQNPLYLLLAADNHSTLTTITRGASTALLLTGVGNLIFTPLSYKFGRRFTYLVSLAVVFTSYIWLANIHSGGEYIGAMVLLGLGVAPFEAMVAVSIADVFFAHERGTKLGFYVLGLNIGTNIGPICSGYIIKVQGWRWVYWWGTILTGVLWLIIFFTLEESLYHRSVDAESVSSAAEDMATDGVKHTVKVTTEKTTPAGVLGSIDTTYVAGQQLEASPFRLHYTLYRTFPGPLNKIGTQFIRGIVTVWYPAVLWSGILYGSCVGWLLVLGNSTAFIFSPPPYSFSSGSLGLIWISPFIGSIFGIIYAGPLNDRFALTMATRNRGFREPEFRLWFFLPASVLIAGGLILFGAAAGAHLHWIAPVVGMGLVGFGLAVGGTIAIAYVVDCYKDVDGGALAAVMLIRNCIGFGLTFSVQPWIQGMGLRDAFIVMGCLAFLAFIIAIPFLIWGKPMRRWTREVISHSCTGS